MQEDVEMKTVMLVINGSKLTGRTLKSAIQKLLAHMRDHSRRDVTPHGKQTVKQLLQKDQGASTIEIRVLRKWIVENMTFDDSSPDTDSLLGYNFCGLIENFMIASLKYKQIGFKEEKEWRLFLNNKAYKNPEWVVGKEHELFGPNGFSDTLDTALHSIAVNDSRLKGCFVEGKVHTIRHKPRFEDDPGQLLWNYTERLVIDRAAETIQFTRNIGTGCSVTHSCYIQEGVPDLLDRFDADELLEGAPGIPEDLVENPDLKIEFAITLDMKKGPQQTCSGYYDCFDLPKRWAAVMDEIWEFVSFYGFVGDMFDPDTYKQRRRRANELIFVYVTFDEYGKEYCYLADEDIYHPGSKVTVPVGIEGKQSTAKVTRIEYLSKEKAPFPLDKIKRIKPIQE